jgi:hypothetical protein
MGDHTAYGVSAGRLCYITYSAVYSFIMLSSISTMKTVFYLLLSSHHMRQYFGHRLPLLTVQGNDINNYFLFNSAIAIKLGIE